jgi:signal peptidase I
MTDAPSSSRSELRETLITVGYALAIALALRVILFQPVTIPSASMEPGVQEGDYVVVSKFDYGWSRASIPLNPPLPDGRLFGRPPRRGDVVVFRLPRDPNIDYIKRVIGLPGDRIQLVHGTVLVNGVPNGRTPLDRVTDPTSPGVTVTRVRETNGDGRSYIAFDRGPDHDGDDTEVYRVPEGCYFMLGDNRDNSLDSRWPSEIGVGLVPAGNLVGRGRFILLSWRQGAAIFKPWTWLNLDLARFGRSLS